MSQSGDQDFQIHEGLTLQESVRKRPAMYIGDVGEWGLHYMINDIVDEALSEAAKGFAHSISVTLQADGSLEVQDDGRGFPAEFLDCLLLKRSLPWNPVRYERDMMPTAVACCLSDRFRIESRHEVGGFVQEFARGIPLTPPKELESPSAVGVRLNIAPDVEIFRMPQFESTLLHNRLLECALLHSGVRISLLDESSGAASHFRFKTGIRSYVQKLNADRTPLHAVAVFKGEEKDISFDVGIQFCNERREIIRG